MKHHANQLTRQVRQLNASLANQKKVLNEFNADRHVEKCSLERDIEVLRDQLQENMLGPSATSTPVSCQEEIKGLEEKIWNKLSEKVDLNIDDKPTTCDALVKEVY